MKKTVLIVVRVVCIVGFLVCAGVLGWYWHSDRSDRAVAEALAAAHDALISDGRDEAVSILFGTESYPERSYDSFCFPAGDYLSMRVCIGEAAGKNWWCCLYPPLCLGAASVSRDKAEEEFISVGLTPSQYRVITETDRPVYRARFKLLELFRNLR